MNQAAATPQLFAAVAIARALNKKRQSVQWQLRGVMAAGREMVNGEERLTYSLDSLPEALRTGLAAAVRRGRYRDEAHLLSAPPTVWELSIPLSDVAEGALNQAVKLREALLPSLERQNNPTLSAAEFERMGAEDYGRVFREKISARWFRELLGRVVARDNGAGQ